MKTIILAAGKSTRLLPLTKETHQCLLKVRNKTILEYQLSALNKAEIKDIIVMCGYMADGVEAFCERLGVSTLFNPFYNVSGMAMTLWTAREELRGGFMLLYSDILFKPRVISDLLKNKSDICLAIKKWGLREEAERVIEKQGLVQKISKTKLEGENGEFIGIAKFSDIGVEKLIEQLNATAKNNLNASFIDIVDQLIKRTERVTVQDIKTAHFVDIDFPSDLKKAEEFLGELDL